MNRQALKQGERVSLHSIMHHFLLGILKLLAGLISGITVVLADAISTFADTLGLFASYIGLHLSRRASDKKFEYGYYKVETFAALLVSLGIIYLGYVIMGKSIDTFVNPAVGEHYPFAITTTIIAVFFSWKAGKKLKEAAEKTNSLSLKANAKDKKMDVFSGIVVLISIVANYKGIPYVEGITSFIIAIIILKVGITSSKESLFFLLDYWDDPILIRKIKKVFRSERDLVTEVKKLRLRRAGTFIFGEAFIEINPFAGIQDLREELDLLAEKIKELNPYIKDFSIYTHISKSEKVRVAVPIKSGKSLNAVVSSTMKQTTAYLFADISKGKIQKFYIKQIKESQKKPVEFAEFLKKEKVQIIIDNKLNSLIYYNLRRTHHILVYPNFADIKNAKKTLELLVIDT